MSLLDRLFRRGKTPEVEVERAPCPHTIVTARWDSVADMGDDSKAVGFACVACGRDFTPEEGERLRAAEVARLRRELGGSEPPP